MLSAELHIILRFLMFLCALTSFKCLLMSVFSHLSLSGQHSLSYEWAWRRLSDPGRMASPAIISELGDHVKSAIKYSFFTHRFDDLSSPRDGEELNRWLQVVSFGVCLKV